MSSDSQSRGALLQRHHAREDLTQGVGRSADLMTGGRDAGTTQSTAVVLMSITTAVSMNSTPVLTQDCIVSILSRRKLRRTVLGCQTVDFSETKSWHYLLAETERSRMKCTARTADPRREKEELVTHCDELQNSTALLNRAS